MPARLKAFFLHLLCSLLVGLLALLAVFLFWYPAPLHLALGVTSIFVMLLVVDVVLGPMLTILVYKDGKRSLFFDLSIIVVLQVSALVYGLWAVSEGRPVWVVFNSDRFDLVQALEVDGRRLERALPEYRSTSWFGPGWVAARRPADADMQREIIFESLAGGSDIAQRPELYLELSSFSDQIRKHAQPLGRLYDFNDRARVLQELKKWPAATAWIPLMARAQPMIVLLGANKSDVLGIAPLNPWGRGKAGGVVVKF